MGKLFNKVKKAQGAFGGAIMIVCSLVMLWGSVSSDVATDSKLREVIRDATDIDPTTPDPSNNGTLVVAAGPFRSNDMYEDEYLKPNASLRMQRRVEMMQWVEIRKSPEDAPTYSLKWFEGQVDFFSSQEPQGHENPLLQVSPTRYQVPQSRFGGFDGSRILPLITRLDRLELAPELLKDPAQEIVENKLVVRRNPGSDLPTLGDMRVWYEALPQGDYTVLTVQQDERSLMGASPSSTLFIRKGLLTADDFMGEMQGESDESFRGMLYLGGLLLFAGCLSLLLPKAQAFDLNPHLNVKGPLAVVIVSAAGSFCVVTLFFLLSFTR